MMNENAGIPLSGIDEEKRVNSCPECGSISLISDDHRGELICPQCGMVVDEESYDFSQARRAFSREEIASRVHNGSPITALTDITWTTTINISEGNASEKLKRAVKWQSRFSWDKKNLLVALTEVRRVCTNLGLPKLVAETAATMYKKVQKKNLLRGRSIRGFVGACIYASCRLHRIPRTMTDIVDEISIPERELRVCYKVLHAELGCRLPRTSLVRRVAQHAIDLQIDRDTVALAERILSLVESELKTSGKDPKGYIAGAIYHACKHTEQRRSQRAIAAACGITEVTLRSRIKDIAPLMTKIPQR